MTSAKKNHVPGETRTGTVTPPSAAAGGQSALRSPDTEELLRRLRAAAAAIIGRASWRQRRDLSLEFFRTLKEIVAPDFAYRVARALTNVAPEPWLVVSEARAALAALGVGVSKKFLYRRARTARRGGNCTLELVLNDKGRWCGPSPVLIAKPIVRLKICCDGVIRFMVSPYK
ncbi:MAG: hypothetical protein NTW87_09630 [Planctomycetota bacterium]|nr:hypothetical protein [Planctomycetota bacterium]